MKINTKKNRIIVYLLTIPVALIWLFIKDTPYELIGTFIVSAITTIVGVELYIRTNTEALKILYLTIIFIGLTLSLTVLVYSVFPQMSQCPLAQR